MSDLSVTRNVRMSKTLADVLDEAAAFKEVKPSEYVRRALKAYLAQTAVEIQMDNKGRKAAQLSNPTQRDMFVSDGGGATDADLARLWGATYDRRG
ncbi:hypothetical protein ACIRPX_16040 [Streptomyces sp. NPDC101225]|uniref:hypothetical protein n=1 Tax=Streptomyces sp. NPDC101225 TaxID=3366135 RepID=UPI0037F39C9C